jgi:hypothetical protein
MRICLLVLPGIKVGKLLHRPMSLNWSNTPRSFHASYTSSILGQLLLYSTVQLDVFYLLGSLPTSCEPLTLESSWSISIPRPVPSYRSVLPRCSWVDFYSPRLYLPSPPSIFVSPLFHLFIAVSHESSSYLIQSGRYLVSWRRIHYVWRSAWRRLPSIPPASAI